MKLAGSIQMKRIDRRAMSEFGVKGLALMENAGAGVAKIALEELKGAALKSVAIVAGKGNNGGDGYVIARHIKNAGYNVKVFSTASVKELKGDASANAKAFELMGGAISVIRRGSDIKKHSIFFAHSALIVDALIGTGLSSNVRGVYASIIDFINALPVKR